jgi:c(7)-type cytochrome triheme protein
MSARLVTAVFALLVLLASSACSWEAVRVPEPAEAAGTPPAAAPATAVESTPPAAAGDAAAPAVPPANAPSRIEQVKEIMEAKKEVQHQYEAKARGADPNAFYRYKVEAAGQARLVDDGLHDPGLDLGELQQPAEALKALPEATFGNNVNWVRALREARIQPRADRRGEKDQFTFDMNIQMPVAGTMNDVVFPHKAHTEWLACANCHVGIFQMKRGGNPITMEKIVKGEYCGACHGKVAFPVASCNRCHSAPSKLSASNK